MLKTNSKKARANVRNYIINHFDPDGYDIATPDTFKEIANTILDIFEDEKIKHDKRRMTHYDFFVEWCADLPSILDTCYYYNRSAVNDLGDILEESETERNAYTEAQARARLTHCIYRELTTATKRV